MNNLIGFLGVVPKFLPGTRTAGLLLTPSVATYLGQFLGWYSANEGAGFIGAVVGAIVVLAIWGFVARRRRSV